MTTILTLPACAAPPAVRQPDTTLDPAGGDPFAAALAAALTAGLIVAQPGPTAPVTLGATAQTGGSSDGGAAVADSSLAAGSQAAETAVASSAPGTPRTPLPIAGVGAKLGEGTVASLAPVERGPLPRHQPTAKPAEPAPDASSGVAASPVPAPRQRPAAAPPASIAGAAGQAPAPSAEPAGDNDVTAAWPGRDAVPVERVVRGAAPSVSASRVAAPPAATRERPAPSAEPAGHAPAPSAEPTGDGDVTAAWPGRDAVTVERVVRGAVGRAPAPVASSQTSETTVASSPPSTQRTPASSAGTLASLAPAAPPVPSAEPAGDDAVTAAWPGRDAVTVERVVRGAAPSLSLSVSASRVAAPPAATLDAPAIEQPAPSPNEGLDALISLAVRRLAARVAGVGQLKRGETEGAAAPAAMAEGDTLSTGSEASLEGTQEWVGDDGTRTPLRLIKFPSMRSRLGRPISPAPADASGAGAGGAPAAGRPSPIRRTTRSGELRVEAPRSAMTPAPSALSAPVPAVAMSVPVAPALSGAASLTEAASPLALVASEPLAPPPAPADRVTLRIGGEDGDATRVWVSVRGDTVHTRIATADAPAAATLTSALGELQSALERHGFTDGSLRVLVPSPGPSDGRTAPPAAQAAVNVAAATTPSRGTDAPSDGNLPGKQRGQDTATDRPGQHGQRPHQRSPRERER